jgi:hypothetical protein
MATSLLDLAGFSRADDLADFIRLNGGFLGSDPDMLAAAIERASSEELYEIDFCVGQRLLEGEDIWASVCLATEDALGICRPGRRR